MENAAAMVCSRHAECNDAAVEGSIRPRPEPGQAICRLRAEYAETISSTESLARRPYAPCRKLLSQSTRRPGPQGVRSRNLVARVQGFSRAFSPDGAWRGRRPRRAGARCCQARIGAILLKKPAASYQRVAEHEEAVTRPGPESPRRALVRFAPDARVRRHRRTVGQTTTPRHRRREGRACPAAIGVARRMTWTRGGELWSRLPKTRRVSAALCRHLRRAAPPAW